MKSFRVGMKVMPSSLAKQMDWWPDMCNIRWPARVTEVRGDRVAFKTGEVGVNFYGLGDTRVWLTRNLIEFRLEENE